MYARAQIGFERLIDSLPIGGERGSVGLLALAMEYAALLSIPRRGR
jgi:hypothetical protein